MSKYPYEICNNLFHEPAIIVEVEELSDEEWESEPLPLEECLFCDHHSESLEKNMEHMTSKHSFFIPHIDCLVNLEGLMMYLGEYNFVVLNNLLDIQVTSLNWCAHEMHSYH